MTFRSISEHDTIQLAKQLDALAHLGAADDADVEKMARASALVQHHDAVTLVVLTDGRPVTWRD